MKLVGFSLVARRGCRLKFTPNTDVFQVLSHPQPIFTLFWHVEECAKQTITHILCDVHHIKAMWHTEFFPITQIPENGFSFPYFQQHLLFNVLFLLSWLRALCPVVYILWISSPDLFRGGPLAPLCCQTDLHVFSTHHLCEATFDGP